MKYIVGQKVKIIGNHNNHGFHVGEVVEISEIRYRYFMAEDSQGYSWCVLNEDAAYLLDIGEDGI